MDKPICASKWVRACTKHPNRNHVFFEKFFHEYKTFVTDLDNANVPKKIHEAVQTPEKEERDVVALQVSIEKEVGWVQVDVFNQMQYWWKC